MPLSVPGTDFITTKHTQDITCNTRHGKYNCTESISIFANSEGELPAMHPLGEQDASQSTNDTLRQDNRYQPEQCSQRYSLIYVVAAFGASFLRFSRRSTMHGLNHLAQARTAQRRLFWLCISLASSLGFFFNLFFLVEKYVQVPVLTNVLHDSDNFIFPDITFCNINPIYFPPAGTAEFIRMTATIDEFEKFKKSKNPFAKRLALADYLFIQRNTFYVHPKWLTIVECSYMQAPCSSEHFDEKIIWPYGACFTFNATKMPHNMTREISTRTRYNRFRPDLRIIVYKALNFPADYQLDPHDSFQVPPGILLMVHEPGTYPHIGHSGIVDECTQIELKMTSVTHLAKLGKCVPMRQNIAYVNAASNESQTFLSSPSDCLDAEVQSALAKHCGCQMHTMPVMYKYHHQPFCMSGALPSDFLEKCLSEVKASVNREHCFLDVCKHYIIDRVIAHTKFPAIEDRHTHLHWLQLLATLERRERAQYKGASDLAKMALTSEANQANLTINDVTKSENISLLNADFVNRNFMMLRLVPASLFMDRVEETEEYPFSRLLSDIGGCVGLWIGASLITLFEFVDLVLDFFDIGGIAAPKSNRWQKFPQHTSPQPQGQYESSELQKMIPSVVIDPNRNHYEIRSASIPDCSKTIRGQCSRRNGQTNNGSSGLPTGRAADNRAHGTEKRPTLIPLFYLPAEGWYNTTQVHRTENKCRIHAPAKASA